MNAEQVTNAVAFKLDQTFGWPVYGKNRQGLKEPCFIVLPLPTSHNRLQGRRYARGHQLVIQYFSATNDDFTSIADQLFDVLEWVEFDGMRFKGTGMNFEVIDDVMHFFIDFNYHVMRIKEPSVKMGRLEQEGHLK